MTLENVTVEIHSMRPKDGDEYPTTVKIKQKAKMGYTIDLMASMRYHLRKKKGFSFPAKEVTLSPYIAKYGKFKGRHMWSVKSITE